MNQIFGLISLIAAVALLFVPAPLAYGATSGDVKDHPDGNQNPPPYGIRLDQLLDENGVFTCSADWDSDNVAAGLLTNLPSLPFESGLTITLNDDGSIDIEGMVFCGKDDNAGGPDANIYDDYDFDHPLTGIYDFSFSYSDSNGVLSGDPLSGTVEVCENDGPGTGSITLLQTTSDDDSFETMTENLSGMANGGDCYFVFATDNHRLCSSTGGDTDYSQCTDPESFIVGRGWFMGDGTRDFLFITPIPLIPSNGLVGGDIIPIESTSLVLAITQSFSWMIPVSLSILGIGMFVISKNRNNS